MVNPLKLVIFTIFICYISLYQRVPPVTSDLSNIHLAELSSDIEFADTGTAREIFLKEARRKEARGSTGQRVVTTSSWVHT